MADGTATGGTEGTEGTEGAGVAEVAVVGFGPVGATLTALLAPFLAHIEVFERSTTVFPLPRAAHLDHEVMRVFADAGVADEVLPATTPVRGMHFLERRDGHKLFGFDAPDGPTRYGWPAGLMFYQPELEAALRRPSEQCPSVHVHLGHDVEAVVDRGDHVELTVRDLASGKVTVHRARYVVGCDGARSTVRRAAGIAFTDLGFDEPWLVLDVELLRDDLDLPDVVLQVCDPARPATFVPMPGHRRRWEFMLLPDEDPAEMERPEVFRRLLGDWVDPDAVEVIRSAVYRFHALVASPWRRGRLLLAGDAAHQMPPFLGQGMCAGVRDAAGLAWRLRCVLDGLAGDGVLDSYETERAPHVRSIIDLAVGMGSIICTLDPDVADARNRQFREHPEMAPQGEPGELLPALGPGVLQRDEHGAVVPPAGTCFINPRLGDVRDTALDELVTWFAVLTRSDAPSWSIAWGDDDEGGPLALRPSDGAPSVTFPEVDAWLDEHGVAAVVLRPDHYVWGVARTLDELPGLIEQLADQLGVPARA